MQLQKEGDRYTDANEPLPCRRRTLGTLHGCAHYIRVSYVFSQYVTNHLNAHSLARSMEARKKMDKDKWAGWLKHSAYTPFEACMCCEENKCLSFLSLCLESIFKELGTVLPFKPRSLKLVNTWSYTLSSWSGATESSEISISLSLHLIQFKLSAATLTTLLQMLDDVERWNKMLIQLQIDQNWESLLYGLRSSTCRLAFLS